MVTLNVGALRRAIEGVPDDVAVLVRTDCDDLAIAGVWHAGIDSGCDDVAFFAIEASEHALPSDAAGADSVDIEHRARELGGEGGH